MSNYSFAEEWPGREAWARKGRRHGRHANREAMAGWAMAKGRGRHGPPSPEELEKLMALRHMRGGEFGGPAFFGRGPRGRGRGRARRGDVRLALLRLLAEEPRNGYQLMQTIEDRSGGNWRPSPGSVYPTLAQLEDEGLIRSSESEGARRFEITDAGREHLETRADEPDPWEQADSDEPSARDLKAAIGGIAAAAWQVGSVGNERQLEQAIQVLAETRRSMYRILAEDAQAAGETDDSGESVV